MTKREGFEDEEDCFGKFDPYSSRDDCPKCWQAHDDPDYNIVGCIDAYYRAEDARRKAEWDAKTLEEQAEQQRMIAEIRKLY